MALVLVSSFVWEPSCLSPALLPALIVVLSCACDPSFPSAAERARPSEGGGWGRGAAKAVWLKDLRGARGRACLAARPFAGCPAVPSSMSFSLSPLQLSPLLVAAADYLYPAPHNLLQIQMQLCLCFHPWPNQASLFAPPWWMAQSSLQAGCLLLTVAVMPARAA